MPNTEESNSRLNKWKSKLPWLLLVLVILAAAAGGFLQYKKTTALNQQLVDLKANPQKTAQDQVKQVVDKVGRLIILPDKEQPTVATVTDLKPLEGQAFFAKAEIGDKVLIYTQAKQAILYSEKLDKIKEVAPLNIGDSDQSVAPAPGNNN